MERQQGWLRPFFAAALVLCGVCSPIANAQDVTTPLRIFKPDFRVTLTPEGKARLQSLENPRYRITHAHSAEIAAFDPSALKPGDRVLINVAPGETYESELSSVYEMYGDYIGMFGNVVGFADSSFQLSISKHGQVGAEGRLYFGGRAISFHPEERTATNRVILVERVLSVDETTGPISVQRLRGREHQSSELPTRRLVQLAQEAVEVAHGAFPPDSTACRTGQRA